MLIRFEKSGGFTGINLVTTIDTSQLPPEEAARLLRELEESGLLDLAPEVLEAAQSPARPDEVTYELTFEVGSFEQTYCLTEETAPDSLQPLFRQLTRLARSSPSTGSG